MNLAIGFGWLAQHDQICPLGVDSHPALTRPNNLEQSSLELMLACWVINELAE